MVELPEPISAYIAAYNAKDVGGMVRCLTEDVRFRNVSNGALTAETRDRAGFSVLAQQGVAAFQTRRQTVRTAITVLDTTVVEIDYEAVVAADLANGWKAGQRLSFRGASLFHVSDGLIREIVDQS